MTRSHPVFAASYDRLTGPAERAGLAAERHRLLGGLVGRVVEIGAGTGLNLRHYGERVTGLTLVEPDAAMRRRLEARLRELPRRDSLDVSVRAHPAERLRLDDASVDAAVSTLTLCSVDDLGGVLAELDRVLRPGGRLALLEHVRGHGMEAVLQELLTPLQRMLAGGCHLNRRLLAAVEAAGFTTDGLLEWHFPRTLSVISTGIAGIARKPASPRDQPSPR